VTEMFSQHTNFDRGRIQFGASFRKFAGQPFDRGMHLTFPVGGHADPSHLFVSHPTSPKVVQRLPGDAMRLRHIVSVARVSRVGRPLFIVGSKGCYLFVGEFSFTHNAKTSTVKDWINGHVGLSSGEHVRVAGSEELLHLRTVRVGDADRAEEPQPSKPVTVNQFAAVRAEPAADGDRDVTAGTFHTDTPPTPVPLYRMSHQSAILRSITNQTLCRSGA
jgi:hypothetical protein